MSEVVTFPRGRGRRRQGAAAAGPSIRELADQVIAWSARGNYHMTHLPPAPGEPVRNEILLTPFQSRRVATELRARGYRSLADQLEDTANRCEGRRPRARSNV